MKISLARAPPKENPCLSGHHCPISSQNTLKAIGGGCPTLIDLRMIMAPRDGVAQNSHNRICARLILAQNEIPSLIVALPGFAEVFGLLPAAVLELDAGAGPFGAKSNLHLRSPVPTRRSPAEPHQSRRLIRGDSANFIFRPVGITLEKAPAHSPFDDHVGQELAVE